MSLVTINAGLQKAVRDAVEGFLAGQIGAVTVPDTIEVKATSKRDHVLVEWDGHVEADIPGPNPDLIRAELYKTHAIVALRISDLRINY